MKSKTDNTAGSGRQPRLVGLLCWWLGHRANYERDAFRCQYCGATGYPYHGVRYRFAAWRRRVWSAVTRPLDRLYERLHDLRCRIADVCPSGDCVDGYTGTESDHYRCDCCKGTGKYPASETSPFTGATEKDNA